MLRIVLSVNDFTEEHISRIREAVVGRAIVSCLAQDAQESVYRAALQEADVVIGWPEPQWLAGTPVQLLQIGSSGWDHYRSLVTLPITLCNAKGVYSTGVAEHAIAMMLGLVRRIPAYVHDKDNRQFRRHQPYPAEIAGTTALLVGVGSIGSEIARRCKGLDMRVIALVRDTTKHCQWADELYPIDQLNEVVGQADHIFLTLPGGPETEKLINRSVLSACRSTAYLYNVSRGSVVDEAALYEWLRDGRLAGAGLDVAEVEPLPVDSPLWTLGDQVLITGHSAGISMGFPDRFCSLVIRNLTRFMANQTLENQVLPSYENH